MHDLRWGYPSFDQIGQERIIVLYVTPGQIVYAATTAFVAATGRYFDDLMSSASQLNE